MSAKRRAARRKVPPAARMQAAADRSLGAGIGGTERSSSSAAAVCMVVQFLGAAIAFRVMGLYRLMDADEGHFLSAIRNVYHGAAPCRDFFYQQTPLMPYPYAAAMRLFGYGYEPCMWVSVLCGAGLAVVTAAYFARRGGLTAGWIGWLLVVLNAQILFWMPTVKNHAMPLFFGTLALFAASRRSESRRAALGWGALAGFAAMWSVGTRLPALPFAVVAGVWVVARAMAPSRPAGAWNGLLGFALGVVPPGLLVLRSVLPDAWVFRFDIVGFHEIRSGSLGTYGSSGTVSAELNQLLRQGQFPAMMAAAVLAAGLSIAARMARRTERLDPAPWLALGGVGAATMNLLPAQTFHQYFMVPLMFFVLATEPLWRGLLAARRRGMACAVVVVLLAAYSLTPWNGSIELFNHREKIVTLAPDPGFTPECSHKGVREMSKALAEATGPNDVVFSTWQGFTFFADRRDLPGNENFNARTISTQLPDDQLRRLHVATNAELAAAVARGEPKAIVMGYFSSLYATSLMTWNPQTRRLMLRPEVQARYEIRKQMGRHVLFVRRQQ